MSYRPQVSDPPTADELLAFAIEADETARACGPFDIAYEHFCREREYFLDAAAKAEAELTQ